MSMCNIKHFGLGSIIKIMVLDREQGRIQDFKLGGRGGAHLNKIALSGGRRESFGVFRVKNHDFTPKNYIVSNFKGGARRVRPLLDPPLERCSQS